MPTEADRVELIVCAIDSDSKEAKRLIDGVLSVNRSENSRTARPSERALTASAAEELSLDVCDRRDHRNALRPLLDARRQLLETLDLSAIGNLVVEVVGERNDGDALCKRNNPCVLKIRCVLRQRLLLSDDCLEVAAHACANAAERCRSVASRVRGRFRGTHEAR